ncbi:MAG: DUF1284 domain-containing protein [Dethiobacter sp.]|nr:DUF1284 domain-containing protein [Dethiobacter sp.]
MTASDFIRLRGHHLLCLPRFRGLGYNDTFTACMQEMVRQLAAGRRQVVLLTTTPDDICACCPHLGLGGCGLEGGEAEVAARDSRVLELLGLLPGSIAAYLSLQEALVAAPYSLPTICAGCRWLDCCRHVTL